MASRFLRLVDANDTFTFQTFHDRQKGTEEDRTLARVIPGPAGKELFNLHDRGAGVYFTVNRTDALGRKGKNITNIRAVWQEDDDGVAVDFPIEPSLVVESSPGRFHRYWLLAEPWPADERGRADHAAVMERMIETYGSDRNAKDICRVLRVPGSLIASMAIRIKCASSRHQGGAIAEPKSSLRSRRSSDREGKITPCPGQTCRTSSRAR